MELQMNIIIANIGHKNVLFKAHTTHTSIWVKEDMTL
jgi:hypothetical protein